MKERLLEVLKANRYSLYDVAEWLGQTYQNVWKKVNQSSWKIDEVLKLKDRLGKRNVDYIFFS